MTKKDIDQLTSRYTQILNEGFFDRFKKKPQEPNNNNQSARKVEDERTIDVNIFGMKRKMSYDLLMNGGELVETIGQEPNLVELKIYQTSQFDRGNREEDIFIPVVVIHNDDYPRPPSIIGDVGRGVDTKEAAMQELTKLGAKYRKNSNNS